MRIRLDIPITDKELIKCTEAINPENITFDPIEYITTDSREVRRGDLFIAIKGEGADGADFTDEAGRLGAVTLSPSRGKRGLIIKDGIKSLADIAKHYKTKLKRLKFTIGITGSVGKSTTKEFASTVISENFNTARSVGNFNNEIGLPLSLLSASSGTEVLIAEMGMNSPGEISRLSKILEPDLAIITNIGTSHIGRLGSREAIAAAKLEITDGMRDGKLIIPYGEPLLKCDGALTFSTRCPEADYYLQRSDERIDLFKGNRWILDSLFRINEYHLADCLAPALVAAAEIGVPVSAMRNGIKKIDRDSLRQRFESVGSLTLYEDYYNAAPESIDAALKYIGGLNDHPCYSAVLGSVLELGEHSEKIHRRIGAMGARAKCRRLYFFGEWAEAMAEGALERGYDQSMIEVFKDPDDHASLAEAICKLSRDGELILLKGSRGMRLEKAVDELKRIIGEGEV